MLYSCRTLVSFCANINSTELHLQGVAPRVNELQQEVITAGKTKGQISIHPLPKIDEMYAKPKGAKVFSTIDLRSGYHHIALSKVLELKQHSLHRLVSTNFLWYHLG